MGTILMTVSELNNVSKNFLKGIEDDALRRGIERQVIRIKVF